MAKTLQTNILFNGVDRVSKVLGGIQRNVRGAAQSMQRLGRAETRAGRDFGLGFSLPATMGLNNILRAQEEFERAQNEFSRRSAITDPFRLKEFEDQANAMAERTRYVAAEVVKLQTELSAAGLTGETVLRITPDVTFGSIAADMSTRDFSDKITNIVSAFAGQPDSDMTPEQVADHWDKNIARIQERLALVAASSNTTFNEALDAFMQFAPISKQLNINLDDSVGMIGALANNGFKAANAGRAFRTGFIRSMMLTPKALRLLKAEGINFADWVTLDEEKLTSNRLIDYMKTIAPGVEKLRPKFDKLFQMGPEAVAENFPNLAGEIADAMGITKPTEIAKLESRLAEFIGSSAKDLDLRPFLENLGKMPPAIQKEVVTMFQAGKFGALGNDPEQLDKMLATMNRKRDEILSKVNPLTGKKYESVIEFMAEMEMRGLPGALDILKAVFNRFQRGLFTAFDYVDEYGRRMNTITDFIRHDLTSMLNAFHDLSPGVKKFAMIAAAAAAIGGPLLIYIGLVSQGLAALVSAAGIVLAPFTAIAGLMTTVATAMAGTGKGATIARAALMRMGLIGAAAAAGIYILQKSWDGLTDLFGESGGIVEQLGHDLHVAFDAARLGMWETAAWSAGNSLRSLGGVASEVGKILGGAFSDSLDELESYFPAFGRLRAGASDLLESLGQLAGNIIPDDIDFSGIVANVSKAADDLANIAFDLGGRGLELAAAGIRELNDAVRAFQIGYGNGGLFAGIGAGFASLTEHIPLLDDFLKNFKAFRISVGEVYESLGNLGSAIGEALGLIKFDAGGAAEWSEFARQIAEGARVVTDAALGAAASMLSAMAEAINNVAAAVRTFKEGWQNGDAWGGFFRMFGEFSGKGALGLFPLAAALHMLAGPARALVTLAAPAGLAALFRILTSIGPLKVVGLALAVGTLTEKLTGLSGVDLANIAIGALGIKKMYDLTKKLVGLDANGGAKKAQTLSQNLGKIFKGLFAILRAPFREFAGMLKWVAVGAKMVFGPIFSIVARLGIALLGLLGPIGALATAIGVLTLSPEVGRKGDAWLKENAPEWVSKFLTWKPFGGGDNEADNKSPFEGFNLGDYVKFGEMQHLSNAFVADAENPVAALTKAINELSMPVEVAASEGQAKTTSAAERISSAFSAFPPPPAPLKESIERRAAGAFDHMKPAPPPAMEEVQKRIGEAAAAQKYGVRGPGLAIQQPGVDFKIKDMPEWATRIRADYKAIGGAGVMDEAPKSLEPLEASSSREVALEIRSLRGEITNVQSRLDSIDSASKSTAINTARTADGLSGLGAAISSNLSRALSQAGPRASSAPGSPQRAVVSSSGQNGPHL